MYIFQSFIPTVTRLVKASSFFKYQYLIVSSHSPLKKKMWLTIHHLNHFQEYSSMVFSISMLLHIHHHYPLQNSSSCKTLYPLHNILSWNSISIKQYLLIPSFSQPLAAITLLILSIFTNLTTLCTSCKWYLTVFVFLCLTYFT